MLPDHTSQVVPVGFHVFPGDPLDIHQLVVVLVHEGVIQVQYVGKAAGHTGTKVVAGGAQYSHQAAGHVLTAVIACAFHHCVGTGVTHGKTFACGTGGKQLASGGTVQTGVTDDGGFLGVEVAATGRLDHQLATGHALAHVVVGVAFQHHVQATHVPDTKTLASRTGKVQRDGCISHALVAMPGGNFTRQAGTDGTVAVSDFVAPGAAGFLGNGCRSVFHHLFRQFALIEGLVALNLAHLRLVGRKDRKSV